MEELQNQLNQLQESVLEKEHEISVLKQDIEALRMTLEALIESSQEASIEQEMPKEEIEAPVIPEPAVQEEEEEPVSEVIEVEREKAIEEEIREMTPEVSEEQEEKGESEHDAIMRTIEELSKDLMNPKSTVSDMASPKQTVSDRAASSNVHDLKKSIGLNERFLYTNELFNGDMKAFTRAVDELNHVESEQDAQRLMNEELSVRYKWDEDNESVMAFKLLVSRKFT